MKKLISAFLLLSMCLSFGSCNAENNENEDYSSDEEIVYKKLPDRGEPEGDEMLLVRSEAENVRLYTDDTKKGKEYIWLTEADWDTELSETFEAISTEDAKNFYGVVYTYDISAWVSVALDETEAPKYIKRSFYIVADEDCSVTLNADVETEFANNDVLEKSTKLGISVGSEEEMEIYDFSPDASNPYRPLSAEGAMVCKNDAGEFVPYESDYGFGETREQRGFDGVSVELKASEPVLVTFAVWLEGMDKDCIGQYALNSTKFEITITED